MKTVHNKNGADPSFGLGKIPPQAVDLEELVIGSCLMFSNAKDFIPFLKPEHFYKDAHQIIFRAIRQVDKPDLSNIHKQLKISGELDLAGGGFYLASLSQRVASAANIEWQARIIQQQFIKREIIRISGVLHQRAYDESEDSIYLFDEFEKEIESVQAIFDNNFNDRNVISKLEQEQDYLTQVRNQTLQMGLSTGYNGLDYYFRFKPGNFVVINGHDNIGKTALIVHMAVVSNVLHGWKWILVCMENQQPHIRQNIIQSKTGKHLHQLSEKQYQEELEWAMHNFTLLSFSEGMTGTRLLKICEKINKKNPHQAVLIDPYNALLVDLNSSKLNSHEYHYEVTTAMRNFCKKTRCAVWVNTHAITESTRRKYKEGDLTGYPMPPDKADVEGGGKFANRADDFITLHRFINHPTLSNITQVHIRKIKDVSTGGKPTLMDSPITLKTTKGYFGFFDEDGKNPLIDTSINVKPKPGNDPKMRQANDDTNEPPF